MENDMSPAVEHHPQESSPDGLLVVGRKTPCIVNRKLLPVKGFYFTFMSAVGVLLPFIGLYMRHLGLSFHETGIIYGIMPFVSFFVRPAIGALADKLKRHKAVLILTTILTGIFYFVLVFVPSRPAPPSLSISTSIQCNTQDSFLQDCSDENSQGQCQVGLSYFNNVTHLHKGNKSRTCTFSCTVEDSSLPQFQACFTNETGPYNSLRCNGTLTHSSHLNFAVQDLKAVLASEIPRDRYHVDSVTCRDYDLKDVLFLKDSKHEARQILCERELSLQCKVSCSQNLDCSKDSSFDKTFFIFFFLFLLANILFAPLFPILDAAAYENLGEDGHRWGQQRLFGTVGFAIFAVTSAFIMDLKSDSKHLDFSVSFYLFLPLCAVSSIIGSWIHMSSDIVCGKFLKNIWNALKYMQVLAFLFLVTYFGILTGGIEAFLFVFLNGLGSSPLLFGFALLVNCSAEVPMLWMSGSIIKRFGYVCCLYLVLLCYAVRLLVYSVVGNPWLVLLVEPVHSVTFGLMYASASSYASVIAPPGMSATLQGLLGGLHFGIGKGIGSLITGFMFEAIGPRWTWGVFSIICVILLVFYVILNMFVFKSFQHPPAHRQGSGQEKREEHVKQEETLINRSSTPTPVEDGDPVIV
ncbi:major facilitator superfamily domain-containing protein 6-A [Aplysia californica]|uniref:Major facilitator superfamily domain-containing protein 6-A n=1 Tax=Aplysia californica TaxID=6500 RepID=A0ABM1VSD5_APLCA|nr:major facilitator superfamily domain-containing protein 6-A [Aplysia californica]XP_035825326.1 major facilitator superfamily domain-containing protein 6-A [Aplysia californica]XP_035825327.1 major facilitator superfamily domain-containing protein 6-A [Aplysia californica]